MDFFLSSINKNPFTQGIGECRAKGLEVSGLKSRFSR